MMPHILRFYDAVQKIVAGRLQVGYGMTWGRACLDLAVQLRSYENWVADTAERPDFVHALMQFLVEQRCRWWEGYYQHFGVKREPVGMADDWINIPFISPAMFRDFVLPYYKQIEQFHGGIVSIHSCGDQTPVQKYMLELKTLQHLEISPWTNLQQTLINVPPTKRLGPFLHPNDVLMASPAEMEARLTTIVEALRGREFVLTTSGLTPIWDDLGEFVRRVQRWVEIAEKAFAPIRQAA
jgi:uroporphyrinogen-III decarboxylase